MIDKLFKSIANRLSNIEELRWIDLEVGQLEIPLESYPVQFPCALIDFPVIDAQQELERNQQLLTTIQIRIGIDLYEDLHMVDGNATPDREAALERLQILTKVHKCLQGYEEDYFTPLVRMNVQTERRDDGIKVFSILYGTVAKDDSAAVEVEGLNVDFSFRKL
ncbi:MAG: hypothetical protein JSR11_03705 [Bacteroidetes bacterium]|nr:hypothetical protein [Bacteroidota bacterium]